MMLDINLDKLREGFWSALPIALPVGGLMAVEMVMIVGVRNFGVDRVNLPPSFPDNYSNTAALGRVLYTDYLLPFELASVVLLVAIVAAITLTLRDRKESKSMDPAKQVLVKKEDRIRIIKMDAVVAEKPEDNSADINDAAKKPRESK
jgi:NADH-quinone oxidoreductase subunit J